MSQIRVDFHDKKLKSLSKQEELQLDAQRKRINLQEEYFVRMLLYCGWGVLIWLFFPKKLTANKDMDDWDNVRVPRPAGESEPIFK
ncbi:hypothetical protein HDU67_004599, partial [Dinochytrium kinnereticum]